MAGASASIAIVAPASRLPEDAAARVEALARDLYGARATLAFHPQCFLACGHFAGDDATRGRAFLEAANDPGFDAVWFARGGYGSCRLDEAVFSSLNAAARRKVYFGYSDAGFLLARMARDGVGRSVHGPMPSDIRREGGEAAVARALSWLVERRSEALDPAAGDGAYAFNLTVLSNLLGAPAEPDFAGAALFLEDVDEPHYRIDRTLYHVTASGNVRRCAGIRLGRVSRIPDNDPPFERTVREIVEYWCARAGVPFLGDADIGHDVDNKVVPFPISHSSHA
jgi:muramoyltetrapeptide carboxypeptidase